MTIATMALWYLLITNDFSNEYVASHSERSLPLFYRFSSLWGGQAGSLLFWGFMLAHLQRDHGGGRMETRADSGGPIWSPPCWSCSSSSC